MKSSIGLMAAATATALLVSSCTSTTPDGPTAHDQGTPSSSAAQAAQNNAADVTFASDMIPHHQQAVRMAGLVPQRSTDPAVIALAAEIAAAQGPEIETMKAFLVQWNAGGTAGQQAHDGGMTGTAMPGMVDDATMTRLESLTGREFDTLWVSSMIGHHEGAIGMAKTEIADGANADAKNLAQQIIAGQQAEITRMKQMGR